MTYPHLDNLIYSIRERAERPIQERLDIMSQQMQSENWSLSTRLSILANIVNDMDREEEKQLKE